VADNEIPAGKHSKHPTCTLSTVGVRQTEDLKHNRKTGPRSRQDHFVSDRLKTMLRTLADIRCLTVITPCQHIHRLNLWPFPAEQGSACCPFYYILREYFASSTTHAKHQHTDRQTQITATIVQWSQPSVVFCL